MLKGIRAPGHGAEEPVGPRTDIVGETNAIFRLCYFPKRWQNADIVMIPKWEKDPRLP